MSNVNIKKAFVDIVKLLEDNEGKKVKSILPEIIDMCKSKQASKNFITDSEGNVTHIFCYYHKKWEALDEVEFRPKKHSSTGYNSMCREGTNQWTRQQNKAKKDSAELLDKLSSGELKPEDIEEAKQAIEAERTAIVPREDGLGSDTQPNA